MLHGIPFSGVGGDADITQLFINKVWTFQESIDHYIKHRIQVTNHMNNPDIY